TERGFVVVHASVHEEPGEKKLIDRGDRLFLYAKHSSPAGLEVVEKIIKVDFSIRHASGASVAQEVVETVHVQATVDQLAELGISRRFAREQIRNSFCPVHATQSVDHIFLVRDN